MSKEFSVDIITRIGVIKTNDNGWNRELNIVSWNGGAPKYDIREWSPDHTHMTRGITMTTDELECLISLYQQPRSVNK